MSQFPSFRLSAKFALILLINFLLFPAWLKAFKEGWFNAESGDYTLVDGTTRTIVGDAGEWTVNRFVIDGQCTSSNSVRIASGVLEFEATNFCQEVTWVEYSGEPIALETDTKLKIAQSGEKATARGGYTVGWSEGFLTPVDLTIPEGENVYLQLTDENGNVLVYIFQRSYKRAPVTKVISVSEEGAEKEVGYHEIFLGDSSSQGATYIRNLFSDFSEVPGFLQEEAAIINVSYRFQAWSREFGGGPSATLEMVEIDSSIVGDPPVFTSHPESVEIKYEVPEGVSFDVSVEGDVYTEFQWQARAPREEEWMDILQSTASSLSLGKWGNTELSGYEYRCVATNFFGSTISNSATLSILPSSHPIFSLRKIADGSVGGGFGGEETFTPTDISDDGSVVVGNYFSAEVITFPFMTVYENAGFFWKEFEGIKLFGSNSSFFEANGVSADGALAVGSDWSVSSIYKEGNLVTDIDLSRPQGISSDGEVVVGSFENTAATWTLEGAQVIDGFPEDTIRSYAVGISDDLNLIAGTRETEATSEAFVWSQSTGVKSLDQSMYGDTETKALAADGSTVVGAILSDTTDPESTTQAFRWRPAGEFEPLLSGSDDSSASSLSSKAFGVSSDGTIVVGSQKVLDEQMGVVEKAVIWDAYGGIIFLEELLVSYDYVDHDWEFTSVRAVSSDGNALTGVGFYEGSNAMSVWLLVGLREVRWTPFSAENYVANLAVKQVKRKGGETHFLIPTVKDWTYQLQFKSQIKDQEWADVGEQVLGNGDDLVIIHESTLENGREFYQVVAIEPPVD